MANSEKYGFSRKAEVTVEKVGGLALATLGIISLDAPVAALGLALYFIGVHRSGGSK